MITTSQERILTYKGTPVINCFTDKDDSIILQLESGTAIKMSQSDFIPIYYTNVTTTDIYEYDDYKSKPTHCLSCGAPLDYSKDRCEYCGTEWRCNYDYKHSQN